MTNEAYKMLIAILEYECDKCSKKEIGDRKQYNHEYYLKVTKSKRKANKE